MKEQVISEKKQLTVEMEQLVKELAALKETLSKYSNFEVVEKELQDRVISCDYY